MVKDAAVLRGRQPPQGLRAERGGHAPGGYGAQERAVRSFYETLFYGDRPFREMVERYGA